MSYKLEKDDFQASIAELKQLKKDNDPRLEKRYQELIAKYGEPERVAYNMRMDSIYDGANETEHLIVRSNSSSADSIETSSPVLLTAPNNLVLIQSN